jgi:hypothetical protein
VAKKIPYNCEEVLAADPGTTGECRDFLPSTRAVATNIEAYLATQAQCSTLAAAGKDAEYAAAKCKREAHLMLPGGRQGRRYGPPTSPEPSASGESYSARLGALSPPQTPLRHRTQSPASREGVRSYWEQRRAESPASVQSTAKMRPVERAFLDAKAPSSLTPETYRELRPRLERLASEGIIDPERLAAFSQKASKNRLYFGVGGKAPPNLAYRLFQAQFLLGNRIGRTYGARVPNGTFLVYADIDAGIIGLRRDASYTPEGQDQESRITALDGDPAYLANVSKRAARIREYVQSLPATADSKALVTQIMMMAFFKALWAAGAASPTKKVTITTEDRRGNIWTSAPISLRGLQHSDVTGFRDPPSPSYYTFRDLTHPQIAAFLTGEGPKRRRSGRRKRGRYLSPLNAKSNPVGSSLYDDAEPLYTSPTEAPMARKKRARNNAGKKFDPLAELMREFGPSARLGARNRSASPRFDAVYSASGGKGPYGISDAPYGSRASLPTSRRNPGIDMNEEGLKWVDFVRAYGGPRDAARPWAKYKQEHGIQTDHAKNARLASLGRGKKAPSRRKRARSNGDIPDALKAVLGGRGRK